MQQLYRKPLVNNGVIVTDIDKLLKPADISVKPTDKISKLADIFPKPADKPTAPADIFPTLIDKSPKSTDIHSSRPKIPLFTKKRLPHNLQDSLLLLNSTLFVNFQIAIDRFHYWESYPLFFGDFQQKSVQMICLD